MVGCQRRRGAGQTSFRVLLSLDHPAHALPPPPLAPVEFRLRDQPRWRGRTKTMSGGPLYRRAQRAESWDGWGRRPPVALLAEDDT